MATSMPLWRTIMLSVYNGYQAIRRTFSDPSGDYQQRDWGDVHAAYSLLWAYYDNALFDRTASLGNASVWAAYKSTYSLYRNIRMIYNPTRRLVDFYAGQVYAGVLSSSGDDLPDGVPSAVPLAQDTPQRMKDAIGQLWQWSNWQARKSVFVRYGSALGSVLVEVTDDTERGKVSLGVCWPGFVSGLTLDAAGNVKSYTLEYPAFDAQRQQVYIFRKEVDSDAFRYFRDQQPFDYQGLGSVVPNPYGFVPAVWVKHADTGSDIGSPAIAGSLGKIDELNNLVSHAHDQIHKVIGSPLVMWTDGSLQNLFSAQKRGQTSEFAEPTGDQESVLMLKGPAGGRVDSLAGALSLSDTLVYMKELLGEIEQDHPELVFYRELRAMSQVTGPAASRLVGDVASRVSEAAANYDQQSIKLFQMAVAIGGMRASSGDWGSALNRQQEKFIGFDLDSYQAGDLDMTIAPRSVLVPTHLEKMLEKQAMWTGVGLAVRSGVPLTIALEDEGWTEEELQHLRDEQEKEGLSATPQLYTPIPQGQPGVGGQQQPGQRGIQGPEAPQLNLKGGGNAPLSPGSATSGRGTRIPSIRQMMPGQ
jgi:hypothetical protein